MPPQTLSWREAALCNLKLACCCAALVAVVWLACQPDMENDAPIAGALLWDRVDAKADPTICADICSWEPLPKFAPDMIWASPVCTEYSRVLTRRPRRLEEGDRLVQRTLQIIQELRLASGLWRIPPRGS